MKMKQFLVTVAAAALALNVSAQSLDEGMKMYRYERYETAKKILKPLAANNAQANYYYGLAMLETGDLNEALATFVKYPEDYANIGGTVRVKFAKDGEEAGMQAANNLADMGKRRDYENKRYAADAVNYAKGGNKQLAVDWYNEVLEKMVTPELLVATGDAYLQLSTGGGKAMDHYEKAVAKDPANSLAYSRMGKLMYSARNYEKALEHWAKAKEADPSNPLPYRDMAEAYTYVGKYSVAKENIEKYYELSDKTVEDKIRYAEILYLAQDYDKAISIINELQNEGVERANFSGILAFSYLEKKDSVSAVKALENARTYFSQKEKKDITKDAYMKYGQIYLRNENADSANWAFNQALSMDQSDDKIAVYREIAENYRKNRDWMNAGKWYDRIYKDFGEDVSATDYFWGGYSYYLSANQPDVDTNAMLIKADTIYGTMIGKFPEQPSGYYWRGRVNASMDSEGEKCLAEPYFTQWLDLEVEGAEKSDRDKQVAYQYLSLCKYRNAAYEDAKKYAELVLAIDAENAFGKQIKELSEKEMSK